MAKSWTKEQVEYFERALGKTSLAAISKHLGKNIKAIEAWRKRNGYPTNTQAYDGIPVYEFAQAVGINDQTIYRYWIREKGLPVTLFKPGVKASKIMVSLKKFWNWAYNHRDFVNFSRIEPGMLGEEPDWVDERRKLDYYDLGKKGWERPWIPEEDVKMLTYLKTYRYTYRQLSELMNRTELSIQNRMYITGCMYRPIAEERRTWAWEEEETLIRMRLAGETVGVIAKVLNRNQLQVKNKWERLRRNGRVRQVS